MNKGFTLIELLISITILTIVTLGFFAWTGTVIQTNLFTRKNNIATSIAVDVMEKLKNVPDDSLLIKPKSGNDKCIGYNSGDGSLQKCQACGIDTLGASISHDPSGFTEYTEFWNKVLSLLYMYDNNACAGNMWSSCKNSVVINPLANTLIDHPDPNLLISNPSIYDIISPVRYENNTTYYVVWSVAYISCKGESPKRKIFVTVYWIEPEPVDTNISSIQTGIASNRYLLKSVSITTDRTTGIE